MAILILVIFLPVAFGLAVSKEVHPAVAWLVPAGLAIFWLVAWQHEAGLTGDSQPGLVALVGAVSVAIALLVVLAGFAIRRRRAR
jgi:LPXTG-motif cell wall-anchored protein